MLNQNGISGSTIAVDSSDESEQEIKAIAWKLAVRLVPLLIVAQLLAYLDRVNLGFASITANQAIGINTIEYSFGVSIFFLSYFLCEYPSNKIMMRVGARLWISRIMITFGLIAGLMAFVVGPYSFYAMRILLGAAEAGFFPGVLLFLTFWFPRQYRARIIATFQVGIPLSSTIGGPISGAILGMDGVLGLHGWQWLYILEALPAVLLGLFCLSYLEDRPAESRWLTVRERQVLQARLDRENVQGAYVSRHGFGLGLLADRRVLFYALLYFTTTASSVGLSFWLPQIIKGFGVSNVVVGLLSAIPFALGCIAMVVWGYLSDRRFERRWFTAIPCFLAAAAMASCVFSDSLSVQMTLVAIAGIGIYAVKGPSLSLMTEGLSGGVSVGGLALVSSLGNLSGFVAPFVMGWIKSYTGSHVYALVFLSVVVFLGGLLALTTDRLGMRDRV